MRPILTDCLSDESTLHVHGTVSRHSFHVWGSENPHITEHKHNSLKVNVWRVLMETKLSVLPFFKNLRWLVTLFWLWWRTMHCIMYLWEQFYSQMVYHLTSPVMFTLSWTVSFL